LRFFGTGVQGYGKGYTEKGTRKKETRGEEGREKEIARRFIPARHL
jgi:hypothetical protein